MNNDASVNLLKLNVFDVLEKWKSLELLYPLWNSIPHFMAVLQVCIFSHVSIAI